MWLNNLTACLLSSRLLKYIYIRKPRNTACMYETVFHCQRVMHLFASVDSAHCTHYKHAPSSILHLSLPFFRSSLQASCLLSPYQSLYACVPLCWGIIVILPPFFPSMIIAVLLHGRIDTLNRYQILLEVAGYTLKNVDVWHFEMQVIFVQADKENKASGAKVSNNSFDNSK